MMKISIIDCEPLAVEWGIQLEAPNHFRALCMTFQIGVNGDDIWTYLLRYDTHKWCDFEGIATESNVQMAYDSLQ